MSAQYTTAEVAQHKDDANGLWIIIDSGVYDITSRFSLRLVFSSVGGWTS